MLSEPVFPNVGSSQLSKILEFYLEQLYRCQSALKHSEMQLLDKTIVWYNFFQQILKFE